MMHISHSASLFAKSFLQSFETCSPGIRRISSKRSTATFGIFLQQTLGNPDFLGRLPGLSDNPDLVQQKIAREDKRSLE
jgi:hypothetical protein